jgi:hypothetical protein
VCSEQENAYHDDSRRGVPRAGHCASAVPSLRLQAGAFGLRPLRYPGGDADTASGGGGKVPGGIIGWLVAAVVLIVVLYVIAQFVL